MRRHADGDWYVLVRRRVRPCGDVYERTAPIHYTEARALLVIALGRGLTACIAERQDWPRHLRPGPKRRGRA